MPAPWPLTKGWAERIETNIRRLALTIVLVALGVVAIGVSVLAGG